MGIELCLKAFQFNAALFGFKFLSFTAHVLAVLCKAQGVGEGDGKHHHYSVSHHESQIPHKVLTYRETEVFEMTRAGESAVGLKP